MEKEALDSILQVKRLSHRQAAVDSYRRKQLAVKLLETCEPPKPSGWGSFLDLAEERVGEESCEEPQTSDDLEPAASLEPVVCGVCTGPGPQVKATQVERTPLARARPVRSSTRHSAKDCELAIRSLLAPSSTSAARASGKRSPGVGLQRSSA